MRAPKNSRTSTIWAAIAVAPTTCTVVFPTDAFTTEDRQLLFIRADERVRWILV